MGILITCSSLNWRLKEITHLNIPSLFSLTIDWLLSWAQKNSKTMHLLLPLVLWNSDYYYSREEKQLEHPITSQIAPLFPVCFSVYCANVWVPSKVQPFNSLGMPDIIHNCLLRFSNREYKRVTYISPEFLVSRQVQQRTLKTPSKKWCSRRYSLSCSSML